jgi:LL-diaminopimelate aminotransferase
MAGMADKLHAFYRAPDSLADYARPFSWVAAARAEYRDGPILDLGVADAFQPPPAGLTQAVTEALRAAGGATADHGYAFHRVEAFNEAALEFVRRSFGLGAQPGLRVLGTAGAKGGLALIANALVEPGDLILVTEPGYPIFALHAARLGARLHAVPLERGRSLADTLEALGPEVLGRAKILAVNFPNNPTGMTLSPRELAHLVELCARHDILLVNDAAYAAIVFSPERRTSLFQVAGAQGHCVEVHTLSKTLQIPGWRIGFLLGSPALLERLERIALLADSGQPRFLLRAAAQALGDTAYLDELNRTVERRLARLVAILGKHGFDASLPAGTFFAYVRPPSGARDGARFASARAAALHLTVRHGIVAIPWDRPGHAGLRFSVAFSTDEAACFAALDARLGAAGYVFEGGPGACP